MWIGCKGLWAIGSRWSNQSRLAVAAINRHLLNVEDIWDYMLNVFWCTWILVFSSREGIFAHFYFCITIFNPMISALYSAFSAEDYDSMITGMVVAAVWIAATNPCKSQGGWKRDCTEWRSKSPCLPCSSMLSATGPKQHDSLGGTHTRNLCNSTAGNSEYESTRRDIYI